MKLISRSLVVRVPSLEQLRYQAPGEWGKLLGFDRIPEVKTLREKVGLLGDDAERTARWSGELARDWMAHDVPAAGVLLIDGHIRVYHGSLTKLPRRHVSRERLCLRGTTDYWVNALDGQPFFCVTKPIDPGLQKTLETDIIPRLLLDIPGQPTEEATHQGFVPAALFHKRRVTFRWAECGEHRTRPGALCPLDGHQ